MNILKREIRSGLKPFIFWSIGLFVLVFAGMTKFTGIENTANGSMNELLGKFPRIMLAVFGMTDVDINTLGGYYSVLAFYALICAVIYSVHLGSGAVSREEADRTYEFIFTKPRSRANILAVKLSAAWIFLLLFAILNYVFSVSAVPAMGIDGNISTEMLLFSAVILFVGSVFLSLSAFIAAAAKKADKGSLYGNLCFIASFVVGIIYDITENTTVIRFFTPLKYFIAPDLLEKRLDPLFAVLCAVLICICLAGAFINFSKKDLSAG